MRLRFTHLVVLFTTSTAFSTLGWAQPGPPGPPEDRPQQRERQRNRDRLAARPDAALPDAPRPMVDRIFNALDADGDGKIDKKEMAEKGKGLLDRLQSQRPAPAAAAPRPQARPEGPGSPDRPAFRGGHGMGLRGKAMQGRGGGMERGQTRRDRLGVGGANACPMCRYARRGADLEPARPFARGMQGSAFQPFGRRPGVEGRPGSISGMNPLRGPGRPMPGPEGAKPNPQALRMLDSNGNGRLEPPEIRAKIEMLERLLDRAEREPIELPGAARSGPPRP